MVEDELEYGSDQCLASLMTRFPGPFLPGRNGSLFRVRTDHDARNLEPFADTMSAEEEAVIDHWESAVVGL